MTEPAPKPVRFPDGNDIMELIPSPTRVESTWVDGVIMDAAQRVVIAHAPNPLPPREEAATVIGIVKDYAHARALVQHFLGGEGNREAPAAEKQLDRAERRLDSYLAAVVEAKAADPTPETEPILSLSPMFKREPQELWWPWPMRETGDEVVRYGPW